MERDLTRDGKELGGWKDGGIQGRESGKQRDNEDGEE